MKPALIELRKDKDIFSIKRDWFKARWHFSFDQYYDPLNSRIGQLIVFNHDTLAPGAAWPMHPHHDIEGISYIPSGEFEHEDSLGNGGVLTEGGVQRMSLGSGCEHSEKNHSKTNEVQFIQMWIIPSKIGIEPGVEQKQFTRKERHNKLLNIAHEEGKKGEGVLIHQKANMYVSRMDKDITLEHEIRKNFVGYLYLIEGKIEVNNQVLYSKDALKIKSDGILKITALSTSEIILVETSAFHHSNE